MGDELLFNFKDVNGKECIGFIKTLIKTTVKGP